MWEIEIIGFPLGLIVKCLSLHYLLGFLVGWLLCLLILTIFSVEDAPIPRFLFWLCVSLCVSSAIVSHVLEDYLLGWF